MKLLQRLVGLALGFLSLLAGCGTGGGGKIYAEYGVAIPPQPPHDPSVTLDGFSYAPPSPAHPGDTITFTATTNKPTDAGFISVRVGDPEEFTILLSDFGNGADDVANDGIWNGELELPLDAAPDQGLPTLTRLHWLDGAKGQKLFGEDLTILDDGEL